jgi:hypothetical protein
MGAYSTVTLTREEVVERIGSYLSEATDEELCDALFALAQRTSGFNYTIATKPSPPPDALLNWYKPEFWYR